METLLFDSVGQPSDLMNRSPSAIPDFRLGQRVPWFSMSCLRVSRVPRPTEQRKPLLQSALMTTPADGTELVEQSGCALVFERTDDDAQDKCGRQR